MITIKMAADSLVDEAKAISHYGVSKLNGAPGRGSGRYELDSGKNPRASKRRGGGQKTEKSGWTSISDMSSLPEEKRISALKSMGELIAKNKIGSKTSKEFIKANYARRRSYYDSMATYVNDPSSNEKSFVTMEEDFTIPKGGSVYCLGTERNQKQSSDKVCVAFNEFENKYGFGFDIDFPAEEYDDYTPEEWSGRLIEYTANTPFKVAGVNTTIDAWADKYLGDKTIEGYYKEKYKSSLHGSNRYEVDVALGSPAHNPWKKDKSASKDEGSRNSLEDEYNLIKDMKLKDAAKLLYSDAGQIISSESNRTPKTLSDENDKDVISIYNIYGAINGIFYSMTANSLDPGLPAAKKQIYNAVKDELKAQGYNGMASIGTNDITGTIMFDVNTSNASSELLRYNDGRVVKIGDYSVNYFDPDHDYNQNK